MGVTRHLFTGRDNATYDLGRVLAAATGAGGLFFQGWALIVNGQAFSMQEFGIGTGALAAGLGALLKLKETTEP